MIALIFPLSTIILAEIISQIPGAGEVSSGDRFYQELCFS